MQIADKKELWEYIEADLYRYSGKTDRKTMRRFKRKNAGFRFDYYMRMCAYYRYRMPYRYFLFPICKIRMRKAAGHIGAEISDLSSIGKGLHIAHSGCIVVHLNAVLGDNVCLSQGVIVGQTIKNGEVLCPTIGNNVYIAPGAKVIGGIHVGNNVAIGANAVVTHDVPDNAVVAGIPARVLHMGGSGEYVVNPYRGKDHNE